MSSISKAVLLGALTSVAAANIDKEQCAKDEAAAKEMKGEYSCKIVDAEGKDAAKTSKILKGKTIKVDDKGEVEATDLTEVIEGAQVTQPDPYNHSKIKKEKLHEGDKLECVKGKKEFFLPIEKITEGLADKKKTDDVTKDPEASVFVHCASSAGDGCMPPWLLWTLIAVLVLGIAGGAYFVLANKGGDDAGDEEDDDEGEGEEE